MGCTETVQHMSDCATHNEPAMENGPCNCEAKRMATAQMIEDRLVPGDYRVESFGEDGEGYVAIFSGTDAKAEAEKYLGLRYSRPQKRGSVMTPYDGPIEGLKKVEANRGLSANEDSQLQRLQYMKEGWEARNPELDVDKFVVIKEFCDGLHTRWHHDTMGWSTGVCEEIDNGRAYSEHMGRAFANDHMRDIERANDSDNRLGPKSHG